jgi:hypothetical protein
MVVRSKAWVCDRSLAGIAGSNPVEGVMSDSWIILCVVMQRSLRRADHMSGGGLSTIVYLRVIVKPR